MSDALQRRPGERAYGSKYIEGAGTKEIAAALRFELKMAQKDGRLPADVKVSIRCQFYSGGSSINCNVTSAPLDKTLMLAPVLDTAILPGRLQYNDRRDRRPRWHPYIQQVIDFCETEMAERNHDGSDSQYDHFDVKFYGSSGVNWEFEKVAREHMLKMHETFIADAKMALDLSGHTIEQTLRAIDAEAGVTD